MKSLPIMLGIYYLVWNNINILRFVNSCEKVYKWKYICESDDLFLNFTSQLAKIITSLNIRRAATIQIVSESFLTLLKIFHTWKINVHLVQHFFLFLRDNYFFLWFAKLSLMCCIEKNAMCILNITEILNRGKWMKLITLLSLEDYCKRLG